MGLYVLSYLHPAMNRRAIVTDALPAPRLWQTGGRQASRGAYMLTYEGGRFT